jgi:hypothetical protein
MDVDFGKVGNPVLLEHIMVGIYCSFIKIKKKGKEKIFNVLFVFFLFFSCKF